MLDEFEILEKSVCSPDSDSPVVSPDAKSTSSPTVQSESVDLDGLTFETSSVDDVVVVYQSPDVISCSDDRERSSSTRDMVKDSNDTVGTKSLCDSMDDAVIVDLPKEHSNGVLGDLLPSEQAVSSSNNGSEMKPLSFSYDNDHPEDFLDDSSKIVLFNGKIDFNVISDHFSSTEDHLTVQSEQLLEMKSGSGLSSEGSNNNSVAITLSKSLESFSVSEVDVAVEQKAKTDPSVSPCQQTSDCGRSSPSRVEPEHKHQPESMAPSIRVVLNNLESFETLLSKAPTAGLFTSHCVKVIEK